MRGFVSFLWFVVGVAAIIAGIELWYAMENAESAAQQAAGAAQAVAIAVIPYVLVRAVESAFLRDRPAERIPFTPAADAERAEKPQAEAERQLALQAQQERDRPRPRLVRRPFQDVE